MGSAPSRSKQTGIWLQRLTSIYDPGPRISTAARLQWAEATSSYESDDSPANVGADADRVCSSGDQAAPVASGSCRADGMIVIPRSMKTLGVTRAGAIISPTRPAFDAKPDSIDHLVEETRIVKDDSSAEFNNMQHMQASVHYERLKGSQCFHSLPLYRVLNRVQTDQNVCVGSPGILSSKDEIAVSYLEYVRTSEYCIAQSPGLRACAKNKTMVGMRVLPGRQMCGDFSSQPSPFLRILDEDPLILRHCPLIRAQRIICFIRQNPPGATRTAPTLPHQPSIQSFQGTAAFKLIKDLFSMSNDQSRHLPRSNQHPPRMSRVFGGCSGCSRGRPRSSRRPRSLDAQKEDGHLVETDDEPDPLLEAGAITRSVGKTAEKAPPLNNL
ncbi:hypothetical protein JHW43_001847 [Diplocarpon mali]|nr:hypothetical protein JHW43_001847 [Diplocarpon mali]